MKVHVLALMIAMVTVQGWAQKHVVIEVSAANHAKTEPIQADLYGSGMRGVILAHGGRFNKESWKKQAEILAGNGFTVLAINYRGDTVNSDGTPSARGSDEDNAADVMAAAAYLRTLGMKAVFAIGGSLGGDAVGNADANLPAGSIDRVVFLGSEGGDAPEKLRGRKLFVVARDDSNGSGPRLPGISKHYERAPRPKELVVLDGSAHAQYLFDTDQGPRLMNEILQFLLAK
jgi:pimeloyl-ACP methyl ester carboxylesterase